MILDKIENLHRYQFPKSFCDAISHSRHFQKGRFEINYPNSFGIYLEYETQNAENALWEAHRKYIDIHLILEGEEIVSVADICRAKSTKPYEDDYELFTAEAEQRVILKKGDFLILFPNEVHRTTEKITTSVNVKKYVFKFPVNE